MAGRRHKKRFYICSEVIDSITDANSGCLGRGLGWFRCGLWWFDGGLGLTWQVNVIKMLLNFSQLLILSQKHILGVRKVFWDGLEVVWVFPRTLTGRITSQKNHFEVNLPFIG